MSIDVLIVDDEADIRLVMRTLILAEDKELRVAGEAENGREALDLVHVLDPDVIVFDERMPEMGGVEAAMRVLQSRPQQRMMLCSAYLDGPLRARAAAAGITTCISKQQIDQIPSRVREVARAS